MAPTKESDGTSQEPEDAQATSLAQGRSRRQKIDKKGRSSAFERLKRAKEEGVKNKYEIEEEQNVYDVVEEGEYSEMVRQRQEDDWIVDDDGSGYVEDGREIFDDEMQDDAPSSANPRSRKRDKRNRNIVRPGSKPKQDIKTMFAAAAGTSTKRKSEREATLADDDILEGLMGKISDAKPNYGSSAKKAKTPSIVNPFSMDVKAKTPVPQKVKKSVPQTKRELSYAERSVSKPAPLPKKVFKKEPTSPEPRVVVVEDSSVAMEGIDNMDDDFGDDLDIKPETDDVDSLCDLDLDSIENVAAAMKEEPVEEVQEVVKPVISEELLTLGWENVGQGIAEQSVESTEVQVDASQLPLVNNSAGDQILRFYWLDAYEDAYHQPGTVYLFGKVYVEEAKTYASCCVTVKNIERRIFILPRVKRINVKTGAETGQDVTLPDVYEEFDRIAEKHRIFKFKSMKVRKSYAFEKKEVPIEGDYLEVRYAADMPALPSDLVGETFSHMFGTNTSSLEMLLVGRKMKGPTWLDIKCPQIPNPATSWCKLEALITNPNHISISEASSLPPPPLVLMTINLRTLPNPKTRQNEIVACSCLVHTKFHMDKPAPKKQLFEQHFCVITTPKDCIFPFDFRDQVKKQAGRMKVDVMPTERGLIGFLLARIHRIDPDILVGHDIYGFDLDVLLHRISANKIPHWSKLSRLKRSEMPRIKHSHGRATFAEQSAICGRILCDVQVSARELIRCRSYDLTELTSQILKGKRTEIDYDQVREMFLKTKDLMKLVELTLMDSNYTLRIMYELNVIPLALQITNICGNVMSRTLMGGRSERNEWLLLHAFQGKSYICPDKDFKKKQVAVVEEDEDGEQTTKVAGTGKRKPAYAGGLVLEPKKGFYDTYILLLDFNSLYPSIIQEYNICFTTISQSNTSSKTNEESNEADLILPDSDLEPGILPTEIRKLVESRKQVKTLMKGSDVSSDQMMQYDIRQKALKLTANSMYGCLGFSFSRFYARPLAALVTGKGREILLKTKDLVQNMGLDVIYGDTDSIMINSNITDLETVYKMGNRVKAEVNKLYRLLEIDIDGVFKSMLLLKKKKYAALSITKGPDGKLITTEEMKGLDIVRRDWCDLAKEAGKFVLRQILSGDQKETVVDNIHTRLQEVAEKVNNGNVPVELFYITKNLTKNPEDYPDKKSLPHVQVALRFNSKGGRKMKAGDTVPYIICEDGSTLSATQRAYHPDELSKQDNLKIDCKYYLSNQIHPVVARLCDPIEGTDGARIAECLGLDPSGYRQAARQEDKEEEDLVTLQLTMEERFQDCDRITFNCPSSKCGRNIVLDSAFTGKDSHISPTLQACPNPDCREALWPLKNKLKNLIQLKIHKYVNKYYQGWLKCEDVECSARTDRVPLVTQRGHPVCNACNRGLLRPEYTDSALYTQLCFYDYVFDIAKATSYLNETEKGQVRKLHPDIVEVYRQLKQVPKRWLDNSDYSNVDLGKLFMGLGLARMPATVKSEQ